MTEERPAGEDLLRYLSGDVSPAEVASLNARLSEDAPFRRRFAELLAQRVHLEEIGKEARPLRARRYAGASAPARGVFAWATVAAVMAVAVLTALYGLRHPGPAAPAAERLETAELSTPGPVVEAPSDLPLPAKAPRGQTDAPAPKVSEGATPALAPPPPPDPPPPMTPPVPPRAAGEGTVVTAAVIDRVQGEVFVIDGNDRTPARAGLPLVAGRGLETGTEGTAHFRFADGTRVEVGMQAQLRDVVEAPAKRIVVARGEVLADVLKQPAGRPLTLVTPQGEARVLGTRLRLAVEVEATLLEVREGRVRLTRGADGRGVDVASGFYAVAAAGVELVARPLPKNLLADPGFESGGQGWRWPLPVEGKSVRSGVRAQRIDAEPQLVENSQDVPVVPGATYAASAWIKTNGLDGAGAALGFLWLDAAGRIVRRDALRAAAGTRPWSKVSGTYVAPPVAVKVRFMAVVEAEPDGAGAAWFDDCEFSRAGR